MSYICEFEDVRVDTTEHEAHHQRYCEAYDSLAEDFNEIVFQFCYVAFFSSASPFVPAISFATILMKKNMDVYKIFHNLNVLMTQKANGILVYNLIFRIFYFIGLITNVSVVLFSNSELNDLDTYIKFAIVLIFVHLVLVFAYLFDISFKPDWLKNKDILLDIYKQKFMKTCKINSFKIF